MDSVVVRADVTQRRRLEDVSLASNDGESVKSTDGKRRWPMFIEKKEERKRKKKNGMEKTLLPTPTSLAAPTKFSYDDRK